MALASPGLPVLMGTCFHVASSICCTAMPGISGSGPERHAGRPDPEQVLQPCSQLALPLLQCMIPRDDSAARHHQSTV